MVDGSFISSTALVLSGSGLTPFSEINGPETWPPVCQTLTSPNSMWCQLFLILANTVYSLSSCGPVSHPSWGHRPYGIKPQTVLLWPLTCVSENNLMLKLCQTVAYWKKSSKCGYKCSVFGWLVWQWNLPEPHVCVQLTEDLGSAQQSEKLLYRRQMYFSLHTASFSLVRSMHIRTSPFFLGTGTMPEHQSVGSSTFVMTTSSSMRSNCFLPFPTKEVELS